MKKMLRFVGIAALAAVIGFGFASCDTGAGLTGDRGPQGGQGLPGQDAPVPGAGLSLAGTTLRGGISIVDYAPNVAFTELGFFYSTITLQNTSTVRKYIDDIDYNSAHVSVVRVDAPVVVALTFTPIALEPGESVQFRIIPLATRFTNNASNYADITIEGSYGAVTFERTVRLELTVGVDRSALEALIADAEGLLLATRVLPAVATDRQHGFFYATQDAIDDLEDALEDAEEGLDDVIYYHNNAETRAEVLAGNAAVTALIGPLQDAIGDFERLRGNAHSVPMPGTFVIYGAATRAIGSELVVTRENTTVPPIGEITFQWQRRVGGTGDWVIIPGAPETANFTPTYGMVQPGNHVRAVARHTRHAPAATNHVEMLAPAAPADTPITGGAITLAAPATGGTPATNATLAGVPGGTATGAVVWTYTGGTAGSTFTAGTVYTATFTLAAADGFNFDGLAVDAFTLAEATTVGNPTVATGGTVVVTVVFPATTVIPTPITGGAITLAAPATGGTPATNATLAGVPGGTATGAVVWTYTGGTAGSTFTAGTVYTATFTLAAADGFNFDGLAVDAFTLVGATTVGNPTVATGGTVVVTVVFEETL